ncbi:hypothetical protein COU80_05785 [Candidatus Peregrinibacteria bacterium CG10_big_fil_rev_8_21_14_0_10_55_24]|nr:MAG: hypothetical protein COU80_05785 [Candidatus Peregrinibacteria bacterium CG10_big_fil_rev_8_21_14_0_10_55_24]
MIEVHYLGKIGNFLFQYCFGRLLAEQLGYALRAEPLPGFPGTQQRIDGQSYPDGDTLVLSGNVVDLPALLADTRPRHIILKGAFQRYEYYRPHRDAIRTWLQPACTGMPAASANDLVMQVRRDDYLRAVGYPLPFSYYEQVLTQAQYDRLVICTDGPTDPFLRRFRRFNPVIERRGVMEDFCLMHSARQIAISQSSFSWWAAFLSHAETIYFPRSLTGPFSPERPDIDLEVDEPRYVYVQCTEWYRFSTRERMQQFKKHILFRVKHFLMIFVPGAVRHRLRKR